MDDLLWKSVLEHLFDDFLHFFFKDAGAVFDIGRGFEFLDKELAEIVPTEHAKAPKYVDKLVKVFTLTGEEEHLLIHIEVQGYLDKDFPGRMFTYFYRIMDWLKKPVVALAILTDGNANYRPSIYQYSCLGTSITYQYNICKVLDLQESVLQEDDNPFAVVILTVLLALKGKRLKDGELLNLKVELARRLFERNIPPEKARALFRFLKFYVRVKEDGNNEDFESITNTFTKKQEIMTIEEYLIEQAKQEGRAKGKEEGFEEGIAKGIEKGRTEMANTVVTSLLRSCNLDADKVASIAHLPGDFVNAIKVQLEGELN